MEKGLEILLGQREKEGTLRSTSTVEPEKGGYISVSGKRYINLSSNDYLGLSSHEEIIKATRLDQNGIFGTASSRLMAGSTVLHCELESKTAIFKNKPSALVYNTGYQANIGVISSLFGPGDVIFSDRLNHASIVDGITLSGARFFRFRHNDMEHLETLVMKNRNKYKKALIVTETVFSMDGDTAPLQEITSIKNRHDCVVMIDEAHATGIFGATGSGMAEKLGVTGDCDIIMGTYSKALGGYGAYVAVSGVVREYLINTSRSFIYSTSLPGIVINADIVALDLIRNEPSRRHVLVSNAGYLRDKLKSVGIEAKGGTQIIPVVVKDSAKALRISEKLRENGYWGTAIRPPTVPENTSRIRISVTYNHTKEMLGDLAQILYDEMCR
ncbi:MAG: 8-amino-7-oxononanoate synthase [Candidatus Omnitrophica bacterium]|nr:8-amino-7-oxononanoate synthase [Candidatus Omnitrophota bacterium]